MNRTTTTLLIILAGAAFLVSQALFTVDEREFAIKFQLGEFVRADYEPGLHWKLPFVNNIRKFEKRVVTLDAPSSRYLTLEKKNLIVDAFIKWRIEDAGTFYRTTRGDERQANHRLLQVVQQGLRNEIGKRTMQEAISGERSEVMDIIADQFRDQARRFGIEVVDVRIRRIELPPEVSSSVYQRMEAERARVAMDLRSRGAEAAERIRADADRQRTVIVAEARRDAERLRGDGDRIATEVYASAFGQDEEFYGLYRSLNAYRNVFSKPEDMLVIDPRSDFFKYFKTLTP